MEFNRNNIDAFRQDAEAALKEVAQKHGLEINMKAVVYNLDKESYHFKVEGGNLINSNTGFGASEQIWNDNCERFALRPDMFGEHVSIRGDKYEIVGLNPRGRTKPVIIQDDKGNRYKISDRVLRKQLG